jgi:hypothetical protein
MEGSIPIMRKSLPSKKESCLRPQGNGSVMPGQQSRNETAVIRQTIAQKLSNPQCKREVPESVLLQEGLKRSEPILPQSRNGDVDYGISSTIFTPCIKESCRWHSFTDG